MVGDSEATATAKLEAAGFNVDPVPQETDSESPGTVIDQSPAGGTLDRLGTTVVITVATAPPAPTDTTSPSPSPSDTSTGGGGP